MQEVRGDQRCLVSPILWRWKHCWQSPAAVILCPAKEEGTAVTAGVRGRTESWGLERDGERDAKTR